MSVKEALKDAELKFFERTKKSKEKYEVDKQHMPGGVVRSVIYHYPYPITTTKGEGSLLYDIDDNVYLNFLNNYGSLIHGQAHPEIVKRVHSAIGSGSVVAASISEQTQLARILCERVPSIEMVRFSNSGTEAVMFAIRAARAYTNRSGIIKMEGGYHGLYDSVEYSSKPPMHKERSQRLKEPSPNSAGLPEGASKDIYIAPFNDLETVDNILKNNYQNIAAIIVEPVMGSGGTIPPQPGYLAGLRELADKYDVVLIFDEIVTLRLDEGGAQSLFGVTPDLTTVGKVIGGGFPVGGFGGRADIMSLFDQTRENSVSHSGTFSGNNISMAAGVATMEMLDKEQMDRLEMLSHRLEQGMQKAIDKYQVNAFPTRVGSMLTLHFTDEKPLNYEMTQRANEDLARLVHLKLMNRGIFTAPRGAWYLATSMTDSQIEKAIEAFTHVMKNISGLKQ